MTTSDNQLPSQNDWSAWLDLAVEDSEGKPQRVMSVGVSLMLENGEHVPQGLVVNGHKRVWQLIPKPTH